MRRQAGNAAKLPQVNQPRGVNRGGKYGTLRDSRLAGYLTSVTCEPCGQKTQHLVLRHSLECKRCLTVRRRRAGDPAPA